MFASKSKLFAHFLIVSTVSLSFYPLASVQAKTLNFGTNTDTVSIPGTLLNSKLAGTGNRCLYVDASGNVSAKGVDCGTATGGDEMGAHSATQNIRLNAYWLSGDGGNEGVFVNSDGNVGIGTNSITAGTRLLNSGNFVTTGTVSFTGVTFAGGGNRMITVDNSGVLGAAAIPVDTNTDIYWTGTAGGGFNQTTARTSLGMGTVGTLNSVSNTYITDVAWSKLTGLPSACSSGQYVTALGSNSLTCSTPAGGVSGSGTANYVSKWTGGSALGNSIIYDNGASVGINTVSPSSANLQINAASTLEALRLVSAASYSPLNIRNSGNTADIFRVDQTGSLAVGSVPWVRLDSYPTGCTTGQYISAVGDTLTCSTPTDTNTDIYWTGTSGGGFDQTTARTSLGMGTVGTLNSVSNTYITDVAWSKLTGLPSACSSGQYVTALGSNSLTCSTPAGGVSGSGTANYVSKWTGGSALGNSIIYDNGTNLGIGNTSPGARVQINADTGEALRLVTHASYSPLNIRNSSNTADIFRVDQSGVLREGQIPFARVTGFSYSETDPNVYAWAKAAAKPSYNFTEISGTVSDAQVPNDITIDNANAVDGQSFTWSNTSNSPTYLWATNSNGTSFLAARASISVNYATSAGSASTATTATTATTADRLVANGANCSAGYYPLGVDASGAVESCTLVPAGSDIYWTGTAINLNPTTGRASLGLGSLATLNSVTTTYISDGTILNADISSSAAIDASKINFGTGTSGQVWTFDGSTGGRWQTASMPTGTNNSTLRYTSFNGWVSSPLLNNDDNSVNINYNFTNTCTNTKLGVNGAINANSLYLSNIINGYCAAGANIAYDSASSVLNFSGAVNAYYFNAPVRPLDGSAASPAFTFNNDTNTGIYRSTTDTMDFATAGARRVTIDSSGNVGINVSPPTQRLDVNGYAKATGFCLGAECITSWPSGGLLSGSGTSGYIGKWSGSTSLNNSVIYQNGTNIGISTTNPGTYKLYISGNAYVSGSMTASSFLYSSDLRLKDNVKTIDQALAKVLSLRGVSFNWRNNGNLNLGLIAQEVEQVFPELVVEQDGYKAVQYGNLVAPLIEAIKEQQLQIMDLNQRISQLEMMNK